MTMLVIKYGSNEALLIEIYVSAAFHNLSSDIPILIYGVGLTSNKFNRIKLLSMAAIFNN